MQNIAEIVVREGVTVLDRVWPEWAQHIDLDRLSMMSCSDCVLGQLWGDFEEAIQGELRTEAEALGIDPIDAAGLENFAQRLGFDRARADLRWKRDGGPILVGYDELGAEWKKIIIERQTI